MNVKRMKHKSPFPILPCYNPRKQGLLSISCDPSKKGNPLRVFIQVGQPQLPRPGFLLQGASTPPRNVIAWLGLLFHQVMDITIQYSCLFGSFLLRRDIISLTYPIFWLIGFFVQWVLASIEGYKHYGVVIKDVCPVGMFDPMVPNVRTSLHTSWRATGVSSVHRSFDRTVSLSTKSRPSQPI